MYQISDDYTNAMLAILDRTPELTYLKTRGSPDRMPGIEQEEKEWR